MDWRKNWGLETRFSTSRHELLMYNKCTQDLARGWLEDKRAADSDLRLSSWRLQVFDGLFGCSLVALLLWRCTAGMTLLFVPFFTCQVSTYLFLFTWSTLPLFFTIALVEIHHKYHRFFTTIFHYRRLSSVTNFSSACFSLLLSLLSLLSRVIKMILHHPRRLCSLVHHKYPFECVFLPKYRWNIQK